MNHSWDISKQYTRIKLCEFESLEATYEASFIGADFLGFHIFNDQEHFKRADKFKEIFQYLPPTVNKTLLTDVNFEDLFQILSVIDIDALQLYNDCSKQDIRLFKERFNNVNIIKVMSEKPDENFTNDDDEFIRYYDDLVDAFLLDSFRIGGTGMTGDWTHCSEIVQKCHSPVFLAGGLTADNVDQAIQAVQPFGVDVENGVSDRLSDGRRVKNMLKCRLFIEKVKEADWKIRKTVSDR
ncbi:phosphoribosylanthranilate isomerase [Desulfobulbus sp. TB]|nr:phosphoribosylanthranilate isomerase [Desulfobulbus sp. TB]